MENHVFLRHLVHNKFLHGIETVPTSLDKPFYNYSRGMYVNSFVGGDERRKGAAEANPREG